MMIFGRARLIYKQMRQVYFSEKKTVSAVNVSEGLITLKFKCDIGKFIAECDRLIQFNFYKFFTYYTAYMSWNNVTLHLNLAKRKS